MAICFGLAGWCIGAIVEAIIKLPQLCYHGIFETIIGIGVEGGGAGLCGWLGGALLDAGIKIPQLCYHGIFEIIVSGSSGSVCGLCGWCGGASLEMMIKAFSALWLLFI